MNSFTDGGWQGLAYQRGTEESGGLQERRGGRWTRKWERNRETREKYHKSICVDAPDKSVKKPLNVSSGLSTLSFSFAAAVKVPPASRSAVYWRLLDSVVSEVRESHKRRATDVTVCVALYSVWFWSLSEPATSGFLFLPNSIKFSQHCLSLVSILMLMDHLSSSRSLISSPYLPHHFIWPKGNNKSLIHYPLTEAAMWKYLITGNKLNFNHLFSSDKDARHIKLNAQICIYPSSNTAFMCSLSISFT